MSPHTNDLALQVVPSFCGKLVVEYIGCRLECLLKSKLTAFRVIVSPFSVLIKPTKRHLQIQNKYVLPLICHLPKKSTACDKCRVQTCRLALRLAKLAFRLAKQALRLAKLALRLAKLAIRLAKLALWLDCLG